MERKEIEAKWLELAKQQEETKRKMQLLDYALRCEDNELAEVFTKDDTKIGGTDIKGLVMIAVNGDDYYLVEATEGWITQLKLRDKVSRETYEELEKAATK